MFDVMEFMKDAEKATLKTVTKGQDRVLKAVKSSVDMVGPYLPNLSTYVPVAAYLPAPKEVIDTTFGFAKKLLDTNKKFAVKLLDATEPVVTSIYGPQNGTAA